MHTKCIHAHKPSHWPEENKNKNKTKTKTKNRYKTHGIMTALTILSCPHNSRHRGYNHHGRPHHLVSPHTSRHRGYSHHLVSATHFTAHRLQSPSCPSHTLHATEATVTTAAVRPPTQCKHSETRRTRKRKRKRKKGKEQCP